MADSVKQACALTVFTPIIPDRAGTLQEVLDSFPVGERSPVARPGRTHFARWVVIPELVFQGDGQRPDSLSSQYLLFTSSFDGPTRDYLDELRVLSRHEVDAVWNNCVGYPGSDDKQAFERYITHNHIPTQFFVTAYPHLPVAEVRKSLELRERLIQFACDTQGLDDAALQRAFLASFPEDSSDLRLAQA